MKSLQQMLSEALTILANIGFNNIQINEIKLNNRLKTTRGQYLYKSKTIEIATLHYKYSDESYVMNTIIHELAHAIHNSIYGMKLENGGHTKEWFDIADYISKNTNYKIEQYASIPLNYDKMNKTEYWYHEFVCDCKNIRQWCITKGKDSSKALRRKKCPNCGRNDNWKITLSKFDHYKLS